MGDAVHDGLIPRSPCSRKTSPGQAPQRPYVATTAQVWALHDVFPDHMRPALLLGAFAGLRTSEVVALRVSDVEFMRGIVSPAIQYPAEPLKSETSRTAVPTPSSSRSSSRRTCSATAGPRWSRTRSAGLGALVARAGHARARGSVEGLPAGFRFHDLRHYFASLLIGSGADVKVVQRRLRHASAMTTLNTYGHSGPTQTSPPALPLGRCWQHGRTRCLPRVADYLRTRAQVIR